MKELSQLPEFVPVPQFASVCGFSATKAWRLVWSGAVPHYRVGRSVRVSRADIVRILDASRTPANPTRALPGALSDQDIQKVLDGVGGATIRSSAKSSRRARR